MGFELEEGHGREGSIADATKKKTPVIGKCGENIEPKNDEPTTKHPCKRKFAGYGPNLHEEFLEK